MLMLQIMQITALGQYTHACYSYILVQGSKAVHDIYQVYGMLKMEQFRLPLCYVIHYTKL